MTRKLLYLTVALAACGHPKLKIGLNVGAAGADVGSMAASEIRQSRAAKDRRVEARIIAQRAVASNLLTPEMMRASLDSLARDESVAVVVSRFLDQVALEAARQFATTNLPFLAVTPVSDGVVAAAGPGFSMVPGIAAQAEFLATQAASGDRIAIVHIDDAYGVSLANALSKALEARGMAPIDTRKYEQSWDEPRVVALGTELEHDKNPSLLYFIGRAPSLQLVWQPFREAAREIRVIGSDLVESTALYANADGAFTGLKYVRFLDPQSAEQRMKDLHDRYTAWIGRGEMTGEAVMVYDAMMLTGEAARAGARTRAQFREYFASLGRSRPAFNGVGGPVAFDGQGQVARQFELAQVTASGVFKAED